MADMSPEKEEKKLTDISGSEGAEGERVEEKQNPPSQSQTGAGDTADDIKVKSEVTKWSIRQKIWDHMEKNDLVKFPRPVHHRIPNFEGAAVAGEKAATLDVFKKAQVIKINPDKPQENCRFLTLEANKTLLVPTPRLRSGLFNKIVPPDGCNKETLRICARSQGVKEYSTPIGLDAKVNVDLVIVGSVAVSEQGYRIGKGEGFADLEFAMMATMGAVGPDTIIVTTVHDCQVTEIPKDLVEDHDLTVDYIVTPTRIIECPHHPKPSGVIWSKLDPDKLERVPVLKKLRNIEKEAGKDTTIKEAPKDEELAGGVDNGPRQDRRRPRRRPRRISGRGEVGAVNSEEAPNEERGQRKPRRQRRPPRNRKNTSEDAQESGENVKDEKEEMHNEDTQPRHSGDEAQPRPRRRRFRQRRRNRDSGSGDQHDENEENEEREHLPQRRMRRRRRGPPRESEGENEGEEQTRRRPQQRREQGSRSPGADESGDDARRERRRRVMRNRLPALFVGSIPRSLRVSEFKANVRDKDVDPIRVIWHGNNGHAFLVFEEKEQIDSALDALKGLNINGRDLRVEVANQSQK